MNKQLFDFSVNLLQALIWQYNSAPNLEALLRQKQEWYNLYNRDFWENWRRDVFDLRTANEFGLVIWSIILGLPLSISLPPTGNINKWGFGIYNRNFNRGPFGSLGSTSSGLSADQARQLLQLRYFQLVTRPTTIQINEMLARVFGGDVYAVEDTTMGPLVYVFKNIIDPKFENALLTFDVLPRPATVGISIVFQRRDVFGYGIYNLNFNRGTFVGD